MEDIVWDQVPGNVREVVLWGLSGGRREGSSKWAGPLRVARRGVLVTCQSSTTWAKLCMLTYIYPEGFIHNNQTVRH